MNQEIDARGLACPAPVLQTKKAIEQAGADAVRVRVDNPASAQNVERFLSSQGFTVQTEERQGEFLIQGERQAGAALSSESDQTRERGEQRKILVLVTSRHMGRGDDALGGRLMVNFLNTLPEMGEALWRLVFLNSGVKLTIEGAPTLETLKSLEENGLTILVCGTCLDHFDLLGQKAVGQTTNMLDIVTALQLADHVISV